MLGKLMPIVNVKVLHMVYFAHFYSHISYGIVFWGWSSSMRNVFIIQKRVFRGILRLGLRSSCREGFKKLDILTVNECVSRQCFSAILNFLGLLERSLIALGRPLKILKRE